MAPQWFLVIVTIGVVVMALAMLVQLGLMLAMYLMFRGLNDKIHVLLDRQVQPILSTARNIVDDARKQLEQLARALEQFSEAARHQMVKIDQVVTEATDRARLQIIRADQVVADTLNRVEQTTEYIQRSVIRPMRELQAVVQGIAGAIGYLAGRRGRRNSPERVTQDEELFI